MEKTELTPAPLLDDFFGALLPFGSFDVAVRRRKQRRTVLNGKVSPSG